MPFLQRDGTALFHEKEDGHNSLLLPVHGWCCDHPYLDPQFEHFAGRGHSVVAVDLRGHGQSDKPALSYVDAPVGQEFC